MLRIALLLLIMANLLLFAWAEGLLGAHEDGREPQRLAGQIAPERLQVRVIDPSLVVAAAESCRLIKGLLPNEAQRLATQAETLGLRSAVRSSESRSSIYWVYIPSLQNGPAAEKKQLELKRLGISNSSVILDEGADKFGISLGLFNSEALANDYLQELGRRGVRSARLQVRDNPLDKAQVEVRGPPEILAKQLPDLLSGQVAATVGDCDQGR